MKQFEVHSDLIPEHMARLWDSNCRTQFEE